VDLVGLKPILRNTTSISALTLLVGSFDPQKNVPEMTYNVFSGTLNPTHSLYHREQLLCIWRGSVSMERRPVPQVDVGLENFPLLVQCILGRVLGLPSVL